MVRGISQPNTGTQVSDSVNIFDVKDGFPSSKNIASEQVLQLMSSALSFSNCSTN